MAARRRTSAAPAAEVVAPATWSLCGSTFTIRPDFDITFGRHFRYTRDWEASETMHDLAATVYGLLHESLSADPKETIPEFDAAIDKVTEFAQLREAVDGMYMSVAARPTSVPASS